MERKWDSRLDALGVRLEAPDQAEYRLVEARWRGPDESGDKHHIYVRVLDRNGAPLQDQEFRITNGGQRIERTKGPGFDDFYGNYPMFAGGVYAVDIPTDVASDRVTGLSRSFGGNPHANSSVLLLFQRGAAITAPVPPPPPADPVPTPPTPPAGQPPAIDAATRARLLALLDQAQAEIAAARALLEVQE